MTYKNQLINGLKQGFLFYAFSTILIAIQFGFYIVGVPSSTIWILRDGFSLQHPV